MTLNPNEIPRSGAAAPLHRKPLTIEQLENILEQDDIEPATRRNLQGKLDNLRHVEQERARTNELSAREIVDSIPRHFR